MPSQPSAVAPRNLLSRVLGVVISPRDTYASVAAHPRAFGVLAVIVLVMAGASLVFFSTKVGQDALLDQQIQAREAFGLTVSDAQYAQIQRALPLAGYFAAGGQFVVVPLLTAAISGVMFLVFTVAMGGEATFAQVFAIVSHGGVIALLQTLFALPLDYAKGSLTSPTTLAVFVPIIDEMSMAGRVLGFVDLFRIWGLVSLAIGIGVLYQKRTGPIATGLLLVYVGIGVVVAVVRSVMAGA